MMKTTQGFTLVELMVVILIVAILAAMAGPLMKGRIDSAKWAEGKAGAGTIASALRAYAAEQGSFSSAPSLSAIGIADADLDGTYFSHDAYAITSASASSGQVSFVITVTAGDSTRSGAPSTPATVTLTCNAANSYVATWN